MSQVSQLDQCREEARVKMKDFFIRICQASSKGMKEWTDEDKFVVRVVLLYVLSDILAHDLSQIPYAIKAAMINKEGLKGLAEKLGIDLNETVGDMGWG